MMITNSEIVFEGKIAPGPDYKIYLTKKYIEHEDEFLPIKNEAVFVSDLKNFENFIIPINSNINFSEYNTIVIWCEAFKEFIIFFLNFNRKGLTWKITQIEFPENLLEDLK